MKVWAVEEGIEGEGTYTIALATTKDVAEDIIILLLEESPGRDSLEAAEVEVYAEVSAYQRDYNIRT